MAHHTSSRLSGIHHVLQSHASAIVAGAAGASCFSLILAGALSLAGTDVRAQVSKLTVAQETGPLDWGGGGSSNDDDGGGFHEEDSRKQAEQHLNGLRQGNQSRERELKQNFRGMKLDLTSIKSLMAAWKKGIDALAEALTRSVEEFWDLNADFHEEYQQPVDDAFQELYREQSYAQFPMELKNRSRELKDMGSRLKSFKKHLKQDPSLLSSLQKYIDDFRSALKAVGDQYQAISPSDPDKQEKVGDLQDQLNDLSDISGEFHEATSELENAANQARVKKEGQRRIKDMARSIKDQEREVKKNVKSGAGAELEQLLESRKALHKNMAGLLQSGDFDPEDFSDLTTEDSELESGLWEKISELNQARERARQEKDTKRTLKDKARTLKDMEKDCKHRKCAGTPLEGIVNSFRSTLKSLQDSAANGEFEEFWNQNNELDDLSREFWKNDHDDEGTGQDLGSIMQDIADAEREISEALQNEKISKELAAQCRALLGQGRDLIAKMQTAGDDEEKRSGLESELSALGNKVDDQCGEFFKKG